MKNKTLLASLASIALLNSSFAGAAFAQAPSDSLDHRLRIYVAGTETDVGGISTGRGGGVDWEMLFSPHVGVSFGVFSAEIEEWFDDDDFRMTPVTVATLFHVTPDRVVDFYVGPGLAWVNYSGLANDSLDLDDGIEPMALVGFDVRPGDSMVGFNMQLKHIFGSDPSHDDDCGWNWDDEGSRWNRCSGDDWDGHSVTISAGITLRF